MAADPGPLRWAWSKTAAPADNLDLIKYDDAGAVGTTVMTYVRADSNATFVGRVTAPEVFVGANPVIADPAAGNALVIGASGMFVPASAVSVPTVIPATATISSTESPVGTFTLGVVVSATAGNTLSAVADGLFVPTPTAVPTVITPGNGVSAAEAPPGTWAVGLVVDPAAGNVLVNSATGLFVPTPAASTPTVINATNGVASVEAPVGTFAVTGVPDPVAGNMLTATAAGFAVLPAAIPISADPGNLLELRADGFYVRAVGLVLRNAVSYNREFYEGLNGARPHNEAALWGVFAVLGRAKSFLDMGCGDGWLVNVARTAGVDFNQGVEVSPDVIDVAPRYTDILVRDLRHPFNLKVTFDLVISWEVGEHIEEQYAQTFAENLARHVGRYLVFTAAVPGQGGYMHVNCQEQDYWRWKLTNLGLAYKQLESNCLRAVWEQTVGPLRYLPNNLQVFKRA